MASGSGCANHTTLGSRVQSDSADAVRSQCPAAVGDPCVVVVAVEHKHRADLAVEPLAAAGELAAALAVAAARQRQCSHQHRSLQSHAGVAVVKRAAHAGDIAPRVIRAAPAAVEHHAVASAVDHMLQCIADWVVVVHRESLDATKLAKGCISCQLALIRAVQLAAAG